MSPCVCFPRAIWEKERRKCLHEQRKQDASEDIDNESLFRTLYLFSKQDVVHIHAHHHGPQNHCLLTTPTRSTCVQERAAKTESCFRVKCASWDTLCPLKEVYLPYNYSFKIILTIHRLVTGIKGRLLLTQSTRLACVTGVAVLPFSPLQVTST